MDPYDPTNLDELDRAILDYFQEGRQTPDQPWGISTPTAVHAGLQERGLDPVPSHQTISDRMEELELVDYLRTRNGTGTYEFVQDPRDESEGDRRVLRTLYEGDPNPLLCPREQAALDRLKPWLSNSGGPKPRGAVVPHLVNGDFGQQEAQRLAIQLFSKGYLFDFNEGVQLAGHVSDESG